MFGKSSSHTSIDVPLSLLDPSNASHNGVALDMPATTGTQEFKKRSLNIREIANNVRTSLSIQRLLSEPCMNQILKILTAFHLLLHIIGYKPRCCPYQ